MRRSLLLLVLAAVSCGQPAKPAAPRVRLTPKDIVQQSTDAIVRIEAGGDKVGTGFIVDKRGLVATNLHVVAGSSEIKVKLHDNSQYIVMQIAGIDPGRDLAVLQIKPTKPLSTLRLGDSDQMSAGDQVIAIGNPLGVFDYSVSSGLVSQVRAVCGPTEEKCPPGGLTLLQISAPISQGSSGGPLFNQFGEVVGVTTLIVAAGQSINFAVPGNYLKPMVAKPGAMSMQAFAEQTKIEEEGPPQDNVRIMKMVPKHPVAILDGCNDKAIGDVLDAITSAIDIGAPLYNRGDIEACFRIYEGTSTKLERDPPCAGVGKAFGEGLLRASTLGSFKEKAWALRDTFDGLIDVAQRRGFKPAAKP
ncbi:MAG: trypsin-like peptidase domain-containing protein [Deltaproteobacteria bacterium]|nr:trypsin-like peptidase domain-containing protein [Deltaproteobacteria bacterium]